MIRWLSWLLPVVVVGTVACSGESGGEGANDSAAVVTEVPEGHRTAVVGAGCFWCVEAFYERLDGVGEVISGYAGGTTPNPTYKSVSRGATDHAEVVEIVYDPSVISYRELIDFFWTTHDATRSDGVWPDFGSQYRSILLYRDAGEKAAIEASREDYETRTGKTIATEIKKLDRFYPAETYHQDYARKNPSDRYIVNILHPKLEKLGMD